ncbi:hypothetical protein BHM03_00001609 [Ensete ventricosum]|nr:hypothetical protein BHM03_00001609 [Ensete ventricosum]
MSISDSTKFDHSELVDLKKGLFFPSPPMPIASLVSLLSSSLSRALSLFPALAGRLSTLPDGRILISCNDAGVEFAYATADSLTLPDLLAPSSDVPPAVKSLFPLDGAISFHGHFRPLASFQLTKLADGAVFLGAAVNHAVVDGTSFWNFFNAWAELCRGGSPSPPDFRRNYFGDSKAVLRFPGGRGPEVTFPVDAPLRERIFRLSQEAIFDLKSRANDGFVKVAAIGDPDAEIYGKQVHDPKAVMAYKEEQISSFQSLCAHVWRSVTRARKQLPPEAMTTFRMAVNCRHRVERLRRRQRQQQQRRNRRAVSPSCFGARNCVINCSTLYPHVRCFNSFPVFCISFALQQVSGD